MIKTGDTFYALVNIFVEKMPNRRVTTAAGFSYAKLSAPNMYRHILIASDKTVIHHSLEAFGYYHGKELWFLAEVGLSAFVPKGYRIDALSCSPSMLPVPRVDAVCGFPVHGRGQSNNKGIGFQNVSFWSRDVNVEFAKCSNGQMVHRFLSCSPHNSCSQVLPHLCSFSSNLPNNMDSSQRIDHVMTPVPSFLCSDGVTKLSYTLACDFRHHCNDRSDETFCQHPPCDEFACSNGQCVSYSKRCDLVSDCLDDSDELMCQDYTYLEFNFWESRSPVLIGFDGLYSFKVKEITSNETCPDTHYCCPGEFNDCLPVYTRCNGWYDCMDHEDEEVCDNITCAGFYCCFNSTVCVHADHLCDGWPHCPQHDDEWLCDMTCSTQCWCQGHTFLCPETFSAHLYPHLRYLDQEWRHPILTTTLT